MPVVIYHANCLDGFGAALAAHLALPDNTRFIPAQYGDTPPEGLEGEDVYILDFSYPVATLAGLAPHVRSLHLLDHHRTALNALMTDEGAALKKAYPGSFHLDESHSGAVLAWEFFHPGQPVPRLFRWIESRDLWTWYEPQSAEFLAWLDSVPQTFANWRPLLDMSATMQEHSIMLGEAMLKKTHSLVCSIAERASPVEISGVRGLAVNAPPELSSETGSLLAQSSSTFGLVWHALAPDDIKCSLRALKTPTGESCNVEVLARVFGGGGHVTAAGFKCSWQALNAMHKFAT